MLLRMASGPMNGVVNPFRRFVRTQNGIRHHNPQDATYLQNAVAFAEELAGKALSEMLEKMF